MGGSTAQLPVGLHRRGNQPDPAQRHRGTGPRSAPRPGRRPHAGRYGRWPVGTDDLLRGLKVVEIGQYVAAPLAATIFSDLGAEVVKVERPGGDPLRADPARFAAWNRGKRSSSSTSRSAGGADRPCGLIDGADLLVENLRPGALGVGSGWRPRCCGKNGRAWSRCSISAWGSTGPSRDEPGWEPLVHARAGAQQGLFTGDDPIWLPFPAGQRRRGAVGRPRYRCRVDQARLDGVRPTRRDVAARRAAVPQRRARSSTARGTGRRDRAPDELGDPARSSTPPTDAA